MNRKRKQLVHTPEGVRDIYNEECEKKILLENRLHNVLKTYGYHPIQTPTFEFFDIFGKEIGTTPSKELYKFFDREGNTLVLRPDITPSIARSAVKYFMDEDMPIRLSYKGNTFINNSSYQGRLKESTQLGAELIGDSSVDADAEILAIVVSCLQAAGLKEFQLSVGHVKFLRGLLDAAGIDEDAEDELLTLISNKNFFGVSELVERLAIGDNLKNLFAMLGNPDCSDAELYGARELAAAYPVIVEALDNLMEIKKVLELYGISRYVSIELGIVSTYKYYTGMLFAAYTFGTGEAVVRGGRYDSLLRYFGKEAASIGFAIVVDQLLAALDRQKIEIPLVHNTLLVVYRAANRAEAIAHARALREMGRFVETVVWDDAKSKQDYEEYAERNTIAEVKFLG